ncbi:MAG TPA: hypothetical protein VEI02_16265 [Planctomycetota bacterium]|nr:hypothetical protein [Planctomycetota bacterium]
MPHVDFTALAAALWAGVLHALVPCHHSWPVLVPLMRRGSAEKIAGWYGAGLVLAGVALGVAVGAGGGKLRDLATAFVEWMGGSGGEAVENAFGVLLIGLGLVMVLRTRLSHAGHVHGACLPDAGGGDASCPHAEHKPSAAARYGKSLGVFALGFASVSLPCFSNVTAAVVTVESGSPVSGGVVYGAYALAAAITTYVILALIRRSATFLARLTSPRFEAKVILASGVGLIAFGVLVLLHLGHDHHH